MSLTLVLSINNKQQGFIGIGVPIVTDAFVRSFVATTCRDIIDDVEKLDTIQDGFIHFQFLRFCHATQVQYINSHIMLSNRCVLQQQHVDCKIGDVLLKMGTKTRRRLGYGKQSLGSHGPSPATC